MKAPQPLWRKVTATAVAAALLLTTGSGGALAQVSNLPGGGATGGVPGVVGAGTRPLQQLGLPFSSELRLDGTGASSIAEFLNGARMAAAKLEGGWVEGAGLPDSIVLARTASVQLVYELQQARRLAASTDPGAVEEARAAMARARDALARLEAAADDPDVSAVLKRDLTAPRAVRRVQEPLAALESLTRQGAGLELQSKATGRVFTPAVVRDAVAAGPAGGAPAPAKVLPAFTPRAARVLPPATAVAPRTSGKRKPLLLFRSPSSFKVIATALALAPVPIVGNIAIHELGHFLAAKAVGARVTEVKLFGSWGDGSIGGYVNHYETTPGREAVIGYAGPVAGILSAGAGVVLGLSATALALQSALGGDTTWLWPAMAYLAANGSQLTLDVVSWNWNPDVVHARAALKERAEIRAAKASREDRSRHARVSLKRAALVAGVAAAAVLLVPIAAGGTAAGAVIASIFVAAPLLPMAYEALRVARLDVKDEGRGVLRRAYDVAFATALGLPFLLLSFWTKALATAELAPVILAAIWFVATRGMESLVAEGRSVIVGGWQASHDQKYRVDPNTGGLRDVRGHKYGSDRYEETRPGPVLPVERFILTSAAGWLGMLFLTGGGLGAGLAFQALLTGALFLSDRRRSRKPVAPPPTDPESKAHAARFQK